RVVVDDEDRLAVERTVDREVVLRAARVAVVVAGDLRRVAVRVAAGGGAWLVGGPLRGLRRNRCVLAGLRVVLRVCDRGRHAEGSDDGDDTMHPVSNARAAGSRYGASPPSATAGNCRA